MNPIRISKDNEKAVEAIVKDSANELLTPSIVVNAATKKGLPAVRKQFVKPAAKK